MKLHSPGPQARPASCSLERLPGKLARHDNSVVQAGLTGDRPRARAPDPGKGGDMPDRLPGAAPCSLQGSSSWRDVFFAMAYSNPYKIANVRFNNIYSIRLI